MKKVPVLSLLFVFLFPFLIGYNSLSTPFNLVPDGKLVSFSKNFSQTKDFKLLITKDSPVFWLSQHIPYAVSGANSTAYHFFHILVISLSSVLVFLIIYSLSQNNLGALVSSLGFTFSTATIKTWNGLGHIEPLFAFLFLTALFSITNLYLKTESHCPHKKRDVLIALFFSLLSLFLATFTNLIAVAIIPALIFLALFSCLALKKITRFVQAIIVIVLSETLFTYLLFTTGSTFNFTLQKPLLLKNLNYYINLLQKDTGWFLPISIFLFIFIFIKKSKDLRHETAMFKVFCLFFLVLSASFLLIISLNPLSSPFLLSPALLALFIFIGCSLSYLFSIIRRLKKAVLGRLKVLGHFLFIIFIIYSFVFFYFQIKETVKEISSDKEMVDLNSEMVNNLAKNLKDDSGVYFIIEEKYMTQGDATGLHLSLFYNKSPQIQRLNPNLLPPLKNGDLIVVSHQYQDVSDSIINQILSRKTLIYNTYLWTIYKIER
jgi:hypothetical protein